ncbi:MAG: hypothetical protein AAF753_10610 [Pseudomonadota bacterium]
MAVIAAAAFAIRLIAINEASLWTDEGYSIWFARQTVSDLWGPIARNEYNPTLYYIALHYWTGIFGESVTAVRSLSALFNAMTIPAIYLSVLWGLKSPQARLVATLASVLFALAFAEIKYAQEARTYTLCVLAVAICIASSIKITADMDERADAQWARLPFGPFACLGFGAALAVWSHYTCLIFLAGLSLFHVYMLAQARQLRIAAGYGYAIAAGVFLVLGGRALWLFAAYALPASDNFWISAPSIADTMDTASIIFGGSFFLDSWGADIFVRALLFGPWPVLGAWALWRRGIRIERQVLVLLIAMSVAAFAMYLVVTFLGKPVFLQRIVLPSQIGWVILCAAAILSAQALAIRNAAAVLLVMAFSISAVSYFVFEDKARAKEPWRLVAEQIALKASSGETVFVTAAGEDILTGYLSDAGRADLIVVSVNGSYRTPAEREAFDTAPMNYKTPVDHGVAAAWAARLETLSEAWLILRHPEREDWALLRPVIEAHSAAYIHYEPGPLGLYRLIVNEERAATQTEPVQ